MTLRLIQCEPVNYAWWNTELAKAYSLGGLAAKLYIGHMVPKVVGIAQNDRDHVRW